MEEKSTLNKLESRPSRRRQAREVLPPPPPNRFVRRLTVGIIVEILTMVAIIVTLASGQFGIAGYFLGLVGVLVPLALLSWSFWLASRDEAQLRINMWELEQKQKKGPPLAA